MLKFSPARFLLLSLAALTLSACQTTGSGNPSASKQHAPGTVDALPVIESLYKRDSNNPELARRYAAALRNDGRVQRAHIVLAPFADKSKDTYLISEFSAVQSALGNYADAEKYARKALSLAPEDGQAHQALGVALEGQSRHKEAEKSFRKALDVWQGDPTPILNNLGLNLASQGFLDEAVDLLRRAAALSPNRGEIERNLRIVTALQEQNAAAAMR